MNQRNTAASVRARLLTRARETRQDFNLVLTRYALERLLYRLSISPHADQFLLKGALLFDLWFDIPHRPTRDADFLGFGSAELPHLEAVFKDVCAMETDDGVTFRPDTVKQYARVIKTEEKGSDVNLATHLLHDAHMDRFDVAVVVSNDSDLLGPIKIVRNELGKKVGILNPQKNPSRAILPHIDFIKQIRSGALGASQFPATMQDATGQFTKPAGW